MQIKTLDDLCTISSSKRIFAKEYVSSGIPFFRSKEVIERFNGTLKPSLELFITEKRYEQIREKHGVPTRGDLLLTSVGTLGIPYVVRGGDKFYFKDGNLTWFRDFQGLDSEYLYYWFLSAEGKAQLKKATIGSSQPAFTIVLLKRLEIRLPVIMRQVKIKQTLRLYDDLIENNLKRIAVLEKIARLHYRRICRMGGGSNWKELALSEVIMGHIGGGWGKDKPDVKHDYPAFVIRGTDIPSIRSGNVTSVPYRHHSKSNLESRRLYPGDIVFEVSGGSKGQPLGRTLLINSGIIERFNGSDLMNASFCKKVTPNNHILRSEMLYLSFLDAQKTGEIKTYSVQSTGISNFKWGDYLKNVKRVIPPADIQDDFVKTVGPLFDMITLLGQLNSKLVLSRDMLLSRLMSGEIKV